MIVDWGLEAEDKSCRGIFRTYRVKIITTVLVVVVFLAFLSMFHVFGRKVGYKTWLVGTSEACFMRLETLQGNLYRVKCYTNENDEPWSFQAGVADNQHGYYFGVYKYRDGGTQRLGVAQIDLHNGNVINTADFPGWVLNFTQIRLFAATGTTATRLYGISLSIDNKNQTRQDIAVFEWTVIPSFTTIRNWPEAPLPGTCCPEERGKTICFQQAALESTSKHNMYYYPKCSTLYEWNLKSGEPLHLEFENQVVVVDYYPRADVIISGALLPVPDKPRVRNADVGVLQNGAISQTGVLLPLKDDTRVPLETSIDSENAILYLLVGNTRFMDNGEPYADSLRLYSIDIRMPGKYKIISYVDFAPGTIYPRDLANIFFYKLVESQDG